LKFEPVILPLMIRIILAYEGRHRFCKRVFLKKDSLRTFSSQRMECGMHLPWSFEALILQRPASRSISLQGSMW